jgi:hypothetical protein
MKILLKPILKKTAVLAVSGSIGVVSDALFRQIGPKGKKLRNVFLKHFLKR